MNLMATLCLFTFLFTFEVNAQTLAEIVTQRLDKFQSEHKKFIIESDLQGTTWEAKDAIGNQVLSFKQNGKYKRVVQGFQATNITTKGKWYVFNEFVVLEHNHEKIPIFVLINQKKLMLVDESQMQVLQQLLIETSYKDGELKSYSDAEVFTFLNGFTKLKN